MVKRPAIKTASELRLRQRNTRVLLRLFISSAVLIVACAIAFERIMELVEGQPQTIMTGFYWTLSTMTTLGLGDIAFTTPIGRLFTVTVLVAGIVMFFFILPFAFIHFFYAPWLETRKVPAAITDHVIIAGYDNIAPGLVARLDEADVPYFVIEPDPVSASHLHDEGISVFTGDVDDRQTYERLRVASARVLLANREDTTNTNITLTVRELSKTVPILATAENEASIDILEMAGASRVFAAKKRLGQQLALRVNSGTPHTNQVGMIHGLMVAELPVHNTPFSNRPLRELKLREELGINVIGVISQSRFETVGPDSVLDEHNVPIVIGSSDQIATLNQQLAQYEAPNEPIVVIGAGKVGRAATVALAKRGVPVHVVEKKKSAKVHLDDVATRLVIGDAAEREILEKAGLESAPGVIISTNDDATNIYLTLYCRRLAPNIRIVSRISHDRNMDAIRRAGADLALSHYSLGIQAVFSMLRGGVLLPLGEGIELRQVAVPSSLAGQTLVEGKISTRTGLNVVAVQSNGAVDANPNPQTPLSAGNRIFAIGASKAFETFAKTYR